MPTRRELSDVHAGQIWRDRDNRMWSGNRLVRVVNVQGPLNPKVAYRQVIGQSNQEIGQVFRSRYDRFQKAFDLVPDSGAA